MEIVETFGYPSRPTERRHYVIIAQSPCLYVNAQLLESFANVQILSFFYCPIQFQIHGPSSLTGPEMSCSNSNITLVLLYIAY